MGSFLDTNIIDGPVVVSFVVASVLALGYLVFRRVSRAIPLGQRMPRAHPVRRWAIIVAIGTASGAAVGIIVLVLTEVVFNVFGLPLDPDTRAWVVGAFAGIGVAVVNFGRGRWWRKVIAGCSIALFMVTAAVGINAGYGLNPTLASLLGVQTAPALAVPSSAPTPRASVTPGPPKFLWQIWRAPADMPAVGKMGTVVIPATASGFVARPAYLYLPPAALVANPPPLPVLILMMGQPGGPDSSTRYLPTLNQFAAAHHGLGPIVLTIDQIGSPTKNPLCIDSPAGKVHTYVMTDVVDYVRSTLHVASGRVNWAVGGYSNGGECALSFGAKHPDVFGSIVDISGEIGPSLGGVATTIRLGFGGDAAAYTAEQPLTIMKANHYTDTLAVFTDGSADSYYGPEGATAEAAAKTAGMTTARFVGQGIGHRSDAIIYGLPMALPLLYPRWGLEPVVVPPQTQ
ncbi:alpha/beta hydrolase [Lacisediminihabitans profunda]|uniref:Esterase n=1 Tax=Lacisediminihabitans profunda TaxID=2594790 RepID=A0A5C8UUA1_9MICO|nr:alpha/beta hydrolase-fold protein [Lacisediminihabitans profunda]TXN31886.1 esterase [Lacisediminihabitans profunda]